MYVVHAVPVFKPSEQLTSISKMTPGTNKANAVDVVTLKTKFWFEFPLKNVAVSEISRNCCVFPCLLIPHEYCMPWPSTSTAYATLDNDLYAMLICTSNVLTVVA